MDDKLIKIISMDSTLCNNWAAGKCHAPEGWRDKKADKNILPDCICKPGNKEILCDKCRPDSVLMESKPSLFEEQKGE